MNTLMHRPLCVLVMFFVFQSDIHAALMSANDSFFGDNSLTFDTSTNLAWLDLSITAGISFNQVSSELGIGGIYSGYRFYIT